VQSFTEGVTTSKPQHIYVLYPILMYGPTEPCEVVFYKIVIVMIIGPRPIDECCFFILNLYCGCFG